MDYYASDYPERRVPAPVAIGGLGDIDAFAGTHDYPDPIGREA